MVPHLLLIRVLSQLRMRNFKLHKIANYKISILFYDSWKLYEIIRKVWNCIYGFKCSRFVAKQLNHQIKYWCKVPWCIVPGRESTNIMLHPYPPFLDHHVTYPPAVQLDSVRRFRSINVPNQDLPFSPTASPNLNILNWKFIEIFLVENITLLHIQFHLLSLVNDAFSTKG